MEATRRPDRIAVLPRADPQGDGLGKAFIVDRVSTALANRFLLELFVGVAILDPPSAGLAVVVCPPERGAGAEHGCRLVLKQFDAPLAEVHHCSKSRVTRPRFDPVKFRSRIIDTAHGATRQLGSRTSRP